ncbi:TPA: hypothetical protein N0F65_009458 [Lagenidium giganteum]|uniref:Nucleotide-diphospho-sugar transferase domain-containing protein n=1 Tax=Lagenidium giganteum TaxID=4803 RepID=A0AAV2ZB68_9STRA|nr:TPA: hypothetical protein N0F65_009458 [Lagenidium giganteum]
MAGDTEAKARMRGLPGRVRRLVQLLIGAVVVMYTAEYAYTVHRTRAAQWDVPAAALWHVANQRTATSTPRGIVLPLFDAIAPLGLSLLQELRGIDVTLPVEVPHCGDLSGEYAAMLLDQDPTVRVVDVCQEAVQIVDTTSPARWPLFCIDIAHCHKLFRSFNIKVLAVVLSRFQEVMLLDADTLFLQNPMALWETSKYTTTGTTFFRDRISSTYKHLGRRSTGRLSEMQTFLANFDVSKFQSLAAIPRPRPTLDWRNQSPSGDALHLPFQPSDNLLSSHVWHRRSGHMMDSSLMLWNKAKQPRATAILASFIALNGHVQPPSYGDKEYFFLSCELAETQYALSDFGVGVIGSNARDERSTLCGEALHYFPESTNEKAPDVLYVNSDDIITLDTSAAVYRTKARNASFHQDPVSERGLTFDCQFDADLVQLTKHELLAFQKRQEAYARIRERHGRVRSGWLP